MIAGLIFGSSSYYFYLIVIALEISEDATSILLNILYSSIFFYGSHHKTGPLYGYMRIVHALLYVVHILLNNRWDLNSAKPIIALQHIITLLLVPLGTGFIS